jgi:hypothetical protein
VREEAALLLALSAVYLELDGRRAEARALYALVIAYVAAFHVYAASLHFAYAPSSVTLGAWALIGAPPLLLLLPPKARAWVGARFAALRPWATLVLAAPFTALALGSPLAGRVDHQAMERLFPAVLVVMVASIDWLVSRASERTRRRATRSAWATAVFSFGASLVMVHGQRRTGAPHEVFWRVFEVLPPGTSIVTDYGHCEPFVGRDGVLVWERAPVVAGGASGHEALHERALLIASLQSDDALVLMRPSAYRAMEEALIASGGEGAMSACMTTSTLVVARTGDASCPALAQR